MTESGLIVIKRYRAGGTDAVSTGAMRRIPSLNLDASQVLSRYRGLDGEPWPREVAEPSVRHGFAPLARLDAILARLRDLRPAEPRELLYCAGFDKGQEVEPAPPGFKRLGIDYGFYSGDDETYSVLFHEIAFGLEPGMRELASLLNEHLLLSDVAAVEAVSTTRQRLLASGADLESVEGKVPRAFLLSGYVGDN
jgi:hypothetical protein